VRGTSEFFAETFLVEPDFMGYGDEFDHLEAIDADSTLWRPTISSGYLSRIYGAVYEL